MRPPKLDTSRVSTQAGLERIPIESMQFSVHSRESGNPEGAVETLSTRFRGDERMTGGSFHLIGICFSLAELIGARCVKASRRTIWGARNGHGGVSGSLSPRAKRSPAAAVRRGSPLRRQDSVNQSIINRFERVYKPNTI
jgi:hypothetical protein